MGSRMTMFSPVSRFWSRQRRRWWLDRMIESHAWFLFAGRQSKSKTRTPSTASPTHDLSSSISSSSSSATTSSSSIPLRKKPRSYRLASPPEKNPRHSTTLPSLSDDSLSERNEHLPYRRRPRSAFASYEQTSPNSNYLSPTSPPMAPSVYLIEVSNEHRPRNSFGLTKTITYVWKNSDAKRVRQDLTQYPKYSIEQVSPMVEQDRRSIPVSSRHITLQRGKIDYWQNLRTSPDAMLTSSCQHHIGSASNLLSTSSGNPPPEVKSRSHSNGQIISITSTKTRQPSLLNQAQDTQWNVQGDGKLLRYSNLKWFSVDQLNKDNRRAAKQRMQKNEDSTTDTGSSSEQYYRSAPPVLQRRSPTTKEKPVEEGNNRSFSTFDLHSERYSRLVDSAHVTMWGLIPFTSHSIGSVSFLFDSHFLALRDESLVVGGRTLIIYRWLLN